MNSTHAGWLVETPSVYTNMGVSSEGESPQTGMMRRPLPGLKQKSSGRSAAGVPGLGVKYRHPTGEMFSGLMLRLLRIPSGLTPNLPVSASSSWVTRAERPLYCLPDSDCNPCIFTCIPIEKSRACSSVKGSKPADEDMMSECQECQSVRLGFSRLNQRRSVAVAEPAAPMRNRMALCRGRPMRQCWLAASVPQPSAPFQ
mmetsp:Transcript_32779/g.78272  ORF Transcript_32779/g.78272 Transcript_32779/m.78272 type:complete len:200 (-) Transcript_32779:46-645(-)